MVRVVTFMSEVIELRLPTDALLTLAMHAHNRDITLNELMQEVVRDACTNTFKKAGACLWCGEKNVPLTRGYCKPDCETRSHSSS